MNNSEQLKNKNKKISKTVKILKEDYVNKIYLKTLDMNPKHFVDEHQFIRYLDNHIARHDGHFYEPKIFGYKYYTPWVYNPHKCICIDVNKIYDQNFDDLVKGYDTIVLDMRSFSMHFMRVLFLMSLASCFSCIRDQFIEDRVIARFEFKNPKNNQVVKYENNSFNMYNSNNKIIQGFNVNKLYNYKCNKVVCISINNNLNTLILNSMGIPIYTEEDNEINNLMYYRHKIIKHNVIMPAGYVHFNTDYKYTKGIPEQYYPLV